MLPKANRLNRRRDFDELFKRGRSMGDGFFTLRYVKTSTSSPIRVGFVISAKTEKSSVKRNRVRRQCREVLRKILPDLVPGHDAAILIKKPFLPLTFQEKQEKITRLLARAGLLARKS